MLMLTAAEVHEYRSIIWLGVFLSVIAICAACAYWFSECREHEAEISPEVQATEETQPSFEETPSNW